METLEDIIDSIEHHTIEEKKANARNRSIGRASTIFRGKETTFWIANEGYHTEYERTIDASNGVVVNSEYNGVNTFREKGEFVVSKHLVFGEQLLYKWSGEDSYKAPAGVIHYIHLNSSSYFQDFNLGVIKLKIGLSGKEEQYSFASLSKAKEAIKGGRQAVLDMQKKQKELEDQKRQLEEENRKKQLAFENEQRRLADEKQREEAKRRHEQEEADRLAAIAAKKAEEESLKKELEAQQEQVLTAEKKYAEAAAFIRKQATLRLNPVLDRRQNSIKTSHIYDGIPVVINGGPGTGKTTTLIQRLKFMISKEALENYRLNDDSIKLTDEEIELVSSNEKNWIFFSPTELLRRYLKDDMNYEGLTDTENKTVVWRKYLQRIIRDDYYLAGDEAPFSFATKREAEAPLIMADQMQFIKDFIQYFVDTIKKSVAEVATYDCRDTKWHVLGNYIASKCQHAQRVNSINELLKMMYDLDGVKEARIPGCDSVQVLNSQYEMMLKDISLAQVASWKLDKAFYDSLLTLAESWKKAPMEDEEDDADNEDEQEEMQVSFDPDLLLLNRAKAMVRVLSLKKYDTKAKLSKKDAQLYALTKDRIDINQLQPLGELAFFIKRYYPIVRNAENYIFTRIARTYKAFRKELVGKNNRNVNNDLLKTLVEVKRNKPLHPQEQALLLGFINKLLSSIYKMSALRFKDLRHKYALAYKELCRPVIGVDEATDYDLMDYFAISSLKHYKISSVTLAGDTLQCLRSNGITDWKEINNPLVFPTTDVMELEVSYRQSPKLIALAHDIYTNITNKPAPYRCYQEDQEVPSPLWFANSDEEAKAQWIVDRVLEIKKNYGFMPSIAVFVVNDEEGRKLKECIEDIGKLETAGIDVTYSNGDNLDASDVLRIFPVDQVKGMEFEAVFFHNLNRMAEDELIDRYLYVGLSRATFYLGVTSDDTLSVETNGLKALFSRGTTWGRDTNEETKPTPDEEKQDDSKMEHYFDLFKEMNMNKNKNRLAPHKPILLLTIMKLIENRQIKENHIEPNDNLYNEFDKVWKNVVIHEDGFFSNAWTPFWHMGNEPFWHLHGQTQGIYYTPSGSKMRQHGIWASLDEDLYALMQDQNSRELLRQFIIEYFLK